ncbi:hypothetical protein CLF_106018 [Clonorchis sinensis]|uniref:Uncharacterized protein n=1 Tax=Clonorchis sinensis TaxID=79923 RepID=G7YEK2_CLOSI|nr:hypothetical protein CLF_106018 [Clonorchis sinensis]
MIGVVRLLYTCGITVNVGAPRNAKNFKQPKNPEDISPSSSFKTFLTIWITLIREVLVSSSQDAVGAYTPFRCPTANEVQAFTSLLNAELSNYLGAEAVSGQEIQILEVSTQVVAERGSQSAYPVYDQSRVRTCNTSSLHVSCLIALSIFGDQRKTFISGGRIKLLDNDGFLMPQDRFSGITGRPNNVQRLFGKRTGIPMYALIVTLIGGELSEIQLSVINNYFNIVRAEKLDDHN